VPSAPSRSRLARRLAPLAAAVVAAGSAELASPPAAPAANPRPAVGSQFHCLWTHYTPAKRRAVAKKLRRAGLRWVRIDVGWWGVEANRRGRFVPSYLRRLDACVRIARGRGLRVLATLWGTPGWANGGRGHTTPPARAADYASAARRLAARYRGRIAAWEIWNEPDPTQSFWRGTPLAYVQLLRAAYPEIKAGDPNAQVVLGGPSYNNDTWVRRLYLLGAQGSFDVLATHPYQGKSDAPPERRDDGNHWWLSHTPAVRQVMVEFGDEDKPIWFTEFGWSVHGNRAGTPNWRRGVAPRTQGRYFVRAIRYTQRRFPYVRVMFWYKERAAPGSRDVHLEGFGLMDANLTARPALRRIRAYLTD
jgi:hypothetical protein